MNKKWLIYGLVFLVIVAAAISAWPYLKRAVYPSNESRLTAQPKPPPPVHEIPVAVVKKMDDAEAKRDKQLSELTLPNHPIIYAKVVDQADRPVSGAKVVITPAMGVKAGNQNVQQTSDSDGTLSFPRKWLVLSIAITKPGYQNLLASSATFQYAKSAFSPPPNPDPSDPVIFVLHRL